MRPLRVRPLLDITLTLAAAGPAAVLNFWVLPQLPDAEQTPGDDSSIRRGDRVALGRFSTVHNTAADALMGISIAAPLVYHLIEAATYRRGFSKVRGRGFGIRYAKDVLLFTQALAINSLMTEILKSAIRRPRPFTFLDPDDVDPDLRDDLIRAQERHDADRSFPSGHASTAFVAASAGATLLTLDLLGRSRLAIAAAWIGGMAAASTVAGLRVASGKHFPSDVVTGALLGIGVGAAVPLAHWPSQRRSGAQARRWQRGGWALTPQSGVGSFGLALTGRFR